MKRLIPVAISLSCCWVVPAFAEQMQPKRPIFGCVDPRATTALAIPDGRLRNRKWVDYVHRTGHCFALSPDQRFETVTTQGPLTLLKLLGDSDMPPVYVQSSDVSEAVSQEPAEPPPPPAASVPQPDVASSTPPPVQTTAPPPSSAPASAAVMTPAEQPAPTPPLPALSPSAPPLAIPPAPVTPAVVVPPPAPAAPVAAVTPPAPMAPAKQVVVSTDTRSSGISVLLVVLVVLALLVLVAIAIAVARQQRRFAHVEDKNWPPQDDRVDPDDVSAPSGRTPFRPASSPQAFRASCVALLEQGGWVLQPSFVPAGAGAVVGSVAPDIVARRKNAILAVRCRTEDKPITQEMIDEAAAMGTRQGAHDTVLATDQSVTQRAHDEAMRLHVHVLRADELDTLSG
jgi:hypothetical protein